MVRFWNIKETILSIIIYLVMVGTFKIVKHKDKYFFLFFTIFYVYILFVINETQFPIYSTDDDRKLFGHVAIGNGINIIPLKDALNMTSLYNIIMMVPFGFGLPFIKRTRFRAVLFGGLLFSFLLESGQLITALIVGFPNRVVDVNDLIFNTFGSIIGFGIYLVFAKIVETIFKNRETGMIKYIISMKKVDIK